MGFTYYQTLVIIPLNHPLTFADLLDRLRQKFSRQNDFTVEQRHPHQIALRSNDGWELRISLEDAPHAASEAQEIAENFEMEEADRAILKTSISYLSTAADPDPNMNYFNEYVFVLEVFEQYPGLYLFDPHTGEIRKT